MPKPLQVAQFYNNVGGWFTDTSIVNQPTNTSPDMLDCRIGTNGSIKKREGDSQLGSANSEAASIRGLYQFSDSSNTLRQLYIAGTKIYNLNISTGGLTALYSSLTDNDDRLYNLCLHNHRAVMTEVNENAVQWNGTDTVITTVQDIQQATALTGTVTFTTSSTAVSGSGTSFTTEISVGDYISKDGTIGSPGAVTGWFEVASITDNTNLVLRVASTSNGAGASGGSKVSANFGKASYCISYHGHLFLLDTYSTLDNERVYNKMWYSALNEPYNFPTNHNHRFREVGRIYGAFIMDEFLYIKTDRGIYRIDFTESSTEPFVVNPIDGSVGSNNGLNVQVVNSPVLGKQAAVWMDKQGVVVFHDNITEVLTKDKLQTQVDALNKTRYDKITSCINTKHNEVWFFVSNSGETTNNRVWCWNYALNCVYPFTGDSACGHEMDFGSNGLIPVTGDYSGSIFKQNTGTNYTNGTMSFKFTTPVYDMGQPQVYKTFRKIELVLKTMSTYTLAVSYKVQFASDWTTTDGIVITGTADSKWGTAIWGTDYWMRATTHKDGKIGFVTHADRRIQFKFEQSVDSKDVEVLGWSVFAKFNKGARGAVTLN